jgi:hypothetical protein
MQKLRAALAGLGAKLPAAMPDVLIVAGVGSISYGAGLLHPAAGFITGGVLTLTFGVLSAMKADK